MCEPATATVLTGMAIGAAMGGGTAALSGGDTGDIITGAFMGGMVGGVTAGMGGAAAGTGTTASKTFAEMTFSEVVTTYGPWAMMGSSTLMQVQGQQQAAQSAAAMANYQSQVAGYNMQVARQQADFTQQDADRELLERKRSLTRFSGQQRSLLAGSGVELSGGTPLNLLAETEAMGQRDITQATLRGQRAVWGAQVGVQQQQFSANKGFMSARAGASQRSFQMGTTLLSSGGSLLKSFPVTQ